MFQSDGSMNGLTTGISHADNHRSGKSIDTTTISKQQYDEKLMQKDEEIARLRNHIGVLESELSKCRSAVNNASTDMQRSNMVTESQMQSEFLDTCDDQFLIHTPLLTICQIIMC
ncbi:unnamed protein product [Trichobilharzia regenti]|nr:unnamed protein product [Trichobilharzia regenti]